MFHLELKELDQQLRRSADALLTPSRVCGNNLNAETIASAISSQCKVSMPQLAGSPQVAWAKEPSRVRFLIPFTGDARPLLYRPPGVRTPAALARAEVGVDSATVEVDIGSMSGEELRLWFEKEILAEIERELAALEGAVAGVNERLMQYIRIKLSEDQSRVERSKAAGDYLRAIGLPIATPSRPGLKAA